VVKSIVAIDGPRVRFTVDAITRLAASLSWSCLFSFFFFDIVVTGVEVIDGRCLFFFFVSFLLLFLFLCGQDLLLSDAARDVGKHGIDNE